MELGKIQILKVKGFNKKGAILVDEKNEEVSLKKEEAADLKIKDSVEVFVYNEKDGFSATRKKPLATVGELKKLKIAAKTNIGYFVDIGIDKDILLPFKEAIGRLQIGESYLLYLYHDKSNRLAVTMNIKDKLKINEKFQVNDMVKGTIYGIGRIGAFVAIENKYDGMIPREELKGIYKVGDEVEARVGRILKTGFITLTLREKAYKQMDADSDLLLELLEENGGILYIGDKSDPEEIKEITGLSKSAFKRAEGALYKKRIIELYSKKIELKK